MSFPSYSKYKASGAEWLGDVPEGWEVKPLKTVASFNDEVLSESFNGDEEIEYVDIGSVSLAGGIEHKETFLFRNAPSRARRKVRNGDVIASTVRTYLKAIAPVIDPPINMIVSTGFAVIRPGNGLVPQFAKFALQTNFFVDAVISLSTGVSYPAINASEMARILITVPPLAEQVAIAAFLDRETAKIDGLIAEQRRLMELLKEKRQAVISHAVTKGLDPNAKMKPSGVEWLGDVPEGWEASKIKRLASRISSGKTPLGGSEVYVDEGITFLRSQNIYDEGLRLDDVVFITESVDEAMSVSRVKANDILLNITGASIGRSCVVPNELPPANVNQHVCVIRLENDSQVPFVGWLFKSLTIKNQIDYSQNGAAREGLNFVQIGEMVFALPPLLEQKAIANFLILQTKQFEVLTAEAQRAIDLLQERRTALISAAVTGQIDVRNINTKETA